VDQTPVEPLGAYSDPVPEVALIPPLESRKLLSDEDGKYTESAYIFVMVTSAMLSPTTYKGLSVVFVFMVFYLSCWLFTDG